MANRSISAQLDFLSPISDIPGMGPKRVEALNAEEIYRIGDLIYFFPRNYVDRSTIIKIALLESFCDKVCTVCATIKKVRFEPGRHSRLRVLVEDDTGALELIWFQGGHFYRKTLQVGTKYLITGKVTKYGHFQVVHPQIETVTDDNGISDIKYLPRYSLTVSMREVGIQQRFICKAIKWVLDNLKHYPSVLPKSIENKKNFPSLCDCLQQVHFPSNLENLELFTSRIKYEELYKTAVILNLSRKKFNLPGRAMSPGNLYSKFVQNLPFVLTDEQKKAVNILFGDAGKPQRMHRLLQGDVGSGKTVVAFISCLAALNEKLQVAWLTPTEVLARQTWYKISTWLSGIGLNAAILLGGISSTEKQKTLKALSSGEIQFIVGTHALLQSSVNFKSLGMVVIDEQHKFGLQQRLSLQEKDSRCDYLLLSATPIPQSLAMTLYGDLDVVTINKGPSGRLPVNTHLVSEAKRADMEKFIADQLQNSSARAYYVVPRIETDDSDDYAIKDIHSTFKSLTGNIFSSVPSGFLHGKMGSEEKMMVMNSFAKGDIKLLVSTSIIEVGVDVPEATIIVIENADRFGLAQLHQLRGRVGRGNAKSYCFLMVSDSEDEAVIMRLSQFSKNNDGFKIAELDLQFRGPGQLSGFKQSGWGDLKMLDIIKEINLFREIQTEIEKIFSNV